MTSILKKKLNKKGFTLAELLIVVAIIAILVAIAIPVFGNSLESAKVATDKANVRAAYAEAVVDYLEHQNEIASGTYTATTATQLAGAATNHKVTSITGGTITFSDSDTLSYDTNVISGTYSSNPSSNP